MSVRTVPDQATLPSPRPLNSDSSRRVGRSPIQGTAESRVSAKLFRIWSCAVEKMLARACRYTAAEVATAATSAITATSAVSRA